MIEREPAERGEGRHQAREAALQMLYQWEVGRASVDEVTRAFWGVDRPDQPLPGERTRQFAVALVRGTIDDLPAIDETISARAEHWRLGRMAVIDRLILRLAVYQFRHAPDVPPAVVINEALELARAYSTEDAVRFINGVLDAIHRDARSSPGGDPEPARPDQ